MTAIEILTPDPRTFDDAARDLRRERAISDGR